MPPDRTSPALLPTFATRRAERLEREQQDGIPARRMLGLPVGEDPDRNNFTITSTSDDGGCQA